VSLDRSGAEEERGRDLSVRASGGNELGHAPLRLRQAAGGSCPARNAGELVVAGLSNKEVAGKLFVTVRTVEANLSKAYAKLGIRSRTELAQRLSE